MSSEFKKTILDWNTIQDKIKQTTEEMAPFQKKIKVYKEQADSLENKIVGYMQENRMGKSKIEMGDIVITMGESKRTESLSKDYIMRKAREFFKDDKMANQFVEFLYNSRQQTIENCLKRKINKKK